MRPRDPNQRQDGPLDFLPDRRERTREPGQERRRRSGSLLDDPSPEREKNRSIIKKVNRVSSGRRKAGFDGVKLLLVVLAVMGVIAGALFVIGNFDFSRIAIDRGNDDEAPPYAYEEPAPRLFDDFTYTPLALPPMDDDMVFYHLDGGLFELPLAGATGWAAGELILRDSAGLLGEEIMTLPPGTGFTILNYNGDWWQIRLPDEYSTVGWVDHRRSFINLPDVVPSIIFRINSADAAQFRSGGYALPGVTGIPLYEAFAFNYRLGRYEYIVPAMLPMARALHLAQQRALEIGHTLIVYEAFRPRSTELAIVDAMNYLMDTNPAVYRAIADSNFTLTWFVSTGISNHQRGAAVDVTMAQVNDLGVRQAGSFHFFQITDFTDMRTHTRIHDLSPASAIVNAPRGISVNEVLNETAEIAGPAMTAGIAQMQRIMAQSGFHPLASEWWHFNHAGSINAANAAGVNGEFYTPTIYSLPPTG